MLKLTYNGFGFEPTKASLRAAYDPLIANWIARGGIVKWVDA